MERYEVCYKVTEYYRMDVMAKNKQEAINIAENADGSCFKPIDGTREWEFVDCTHVVPVSATGELIYGDLPDNELPDNKRHDDELHDNELPNDEILKMVQKAMMRKE